MISSLDILFLRKPLLNYVCPPICEVSFSNSSGPVIILDPLSRPKSPSGFEIRGTGKFRLSWNSYPGALCFSVYKAVDELDPFGAYMIIAECITDNFFDGLDPGVYRVSVITEEGESDPSPPITVGVVGPATTVSVVATGPDAQEDPHNGKFTLIREGSLAGNITVHFTLGGTAVSGIDYEPIETSVEIPDSIGFVDIEVIPISDPDIQGDRTVVLTVSPSVNYVIGSPSFDIVTIHDAVIVTVMADPNATSIAGGGPGKFIVNRTGLLAGDLIVNFVLSGTAVDGTDYTMVVPPVTILDGQEDADVLITPLTPGTDTVVLTLATGDEYDIGVPGEATVTITPCPPETGPATPADHVPGGEQLIGTAVLDIAVGVWTAIFGGGLPTTFKVKYVAGAYLRHQTVLDCGFSGDTWRIDGPTQPIRIYVDGVNVENIPTAGYQVSQAAVEAVLAGYNSGVYAGSEIHLQYANDVCTLLHGANGSPNPTFGIYDTNSTGSDTLVIPNNLRITGYNPLVFFPLQCPDMSTGSGDPDWAGTFHISASTLNNRVWTFSPFGSFVINDVSITLDTIISFVTDHPSSANGRGWRLDIAYLTNTFDSVVGWRGYKGVGNSPVGRYYRTSGCQTGPDCITIESF